MEAKELIKIARRNLIFFIIFALVGALVGFYSNKLLPSGYRQSRVLFVTSSKVSEPNAIIVQDPATNVADSAVSVIPSQDFLLYSQVKSTVEVKKLAPLVIRITATSHSPEQSQQDLETLISSFNTKISQLRSDASVQLAPVGTNTQASYFAFNSKILTLFGALIGVAAAITILAVSLYLKL